MQHRVVVTGMGVVSPLGNDVAAFWEGIKAGRSGIRRLESADYNNIGTQIAGLVDLFDGSRYFDAKELKTWDLFIQYGCAAALQALGQSGLNVKTADQDRLGIYIGSGAGGLATLLRNHQILLEKGPRRVSPHMIPMSINNMAAGLVAIKTGFGGPSFAAVSACASSNHAIGEAYLSIMHGDTDAILAGGAEAPINPLYFAAFSNMRAMSTRNDMPQAASRPFDRDRDGFVMAEGSGVLLLEEHDHARRRGANILGEVVGYGSTTDAYHVTTPSHEGAARAIRLALARAAIAPESVDYINAHGTGTLAGDLSETRAIKAAFGTQAYRLKVSSTKSMTGHLFGAAGGVEAIVAVKSILDGIFPPTINLTHPDPECDLDYVGSRAVPGEIGVALSNGFGFGGHNAVIAFKRYRE